MVLNLVKSVQADSSTNPATVSVTAYPLWTDTGVYLYEGESVEITASGLWTWDPTHTCGPDGDYLPGYESSDYFFSGANVGELIGYVGSDPTQGHWRDSSFFPQSTGYWAVGNCGNFTCTSSGELWLGINDDATWGDTGDNFGSLTANIILNPQSITFAASGIDAALGSATVLTIDGTSYSASALPLTFSWANDSSHLVTASLQGYKFTSWSATGGIMVADSSASSTTLTVDASGTVSANFIPLQATTLTVNCSPSPVQVYQDVMISGTLTSNGVNLSDKAINIAISMGSQEVFSTSTVTASDGSYGYTLPAQGVGSFIVTATSSDDSVYAGSTSSTTLTVTGLPTQITVNCTPNQIYAGQNVTVSGFLTGEGVGLAGETINVTVTGDSGQKGFTTQAETGSDGSYSFTRSSVGASVGSYTFTASFAANGVYADCNAITTATIIPQIPTAITVNANPTEVSQSDNITFSGVLSCDGISLAGEQVNLTITLGSKVLFTTVLTTASDGSYAITAYPITGHPYAEGAWTINVAFNGDAQYAASTATTTVNVSPFVAPEYQWGAFLALMAAFAAFAIFQAKKTQTPNFHDPKSK